jgi:hypothetical protein
MITSSHRPRRSALLAGDDCGPGPSTSARSTYLEPHRERLQERLAADRRTLRRIERSMTTVKHEEASALAAGAEDKDIRHDTHEHDQRRVRRREGKVDGAGDGARSPRMKILRERPWLEVPPLDPRDPDVLRVKAIAAAAGQAKPQRR